MTKFRNPIDFHKERNRTKPKKKKTKELSPQCRVPLVLLETVQNNLKKKKKVRKNANVQQSWPPFKWQIETVTRHCSFTIHLYMNKINQLIYYENNEYHNQINQRINYKNSYEIKSQIIFFFN